MIKEKKIKIKGHPRNIKYYSSKGYNIKVGEVIEVKSHDLSRGTSANITSICEKCKSEYSNAFKDYYNYTKGLTEMYYCKKCKSIKSEKTNLGKYGVKNPMQNQEIKDKLKNSLIDKYGVDHYSKTEEYKAKFKQTSIKNWGVDNPSKSKKVINKIKKTNNKRMGVDWAMQSNITIEKSRKSFMDKYGVDWISKSDFYKNKIVTTSNEKWGFDNYSQTEEYRTKVAKTNMEKWGGHPLKTEDFKLRSKNTKQRKTFKKYADLISEKYNLISYEDELFELKHLECGKSFTINKGLLSARYNLSKQICVECNPIGVVYSNFEKNVGEFINSLNINYIKNDKRLLGGKEIDIFIPEHNIAIECNGLYWHSELFKSKSYHKNKTMMCQEKGITLLHIWEDDWANKREIIKSVIKYKLGIIDSKIWARKCDIRNVDTKDYKDFLNNNHIQGYAPSSINIGLYHNEELVSLMTFGWRRTNNKREYELIRFCNKIDTTVIGGASRLFKYLINNNEVEEIISYADISLFEGGLYKSLGFEKVNVSDPNYFWVVDGVKRHRYNYSKRKLVNQGYDSNKTEVEIMNDRGYYRIFSTGQEKYLYK